MGSINYLQAIKPDVAKLRKLVENSLLSDWVVRVEFETGESESEDWQQWDDSFFAISSADPVLAAISDCYDKNPGYAIRINAEKFRPQTRMLFMVYKPQPARSTTGIESQISEYISPENQDRTTHSEGLIARN